MAPKAISSFHESTLPRIHIPNSDQRVLTVSEPCACSRYTVLSLGVTRNSTGSIGNLYPNFHFWLKSRLTAFLHSEPNLADPPAGRARRSDIFFILSLCTPRTQKFSWVDSRPTRGSPSSLNSSLKRHIYIYLYIESDMLVLRPRVCFGSWTKSAFGAITFGCGSRES